MPSTRSSRRVPGVAAVGVINDLPLAGNQMSFADPRRGRDRRRRASAARDGAVASPGYFEVLRIPVVEGRGMSRDDVGRSRARGGRQPQCGDQYFAGRAVGQRVEIGDTRRWARIVGVVGRQPACGIRGRGRRRSSTCRTRKSRSTFINWMGILVRGPSAATLVRSVKARIAAIDPAQPVYDVMLVDDYIARAQAPYRLNSWIVGGLAAISLLLAVAGVFALTTYNAASRRQEFGIRLALGATRGDVLRLVLRQVLTLVDRRHWRRRGRRARWPPIAHRAALRDDPDRPASLRRRRRRLPGRGSAGRPAAGLRSARLDPAARSARSK